MLLSQKKTWYKKLYVASIIVSVPWNILCNFSRRNFLNKNKKIFKLVISRN